MPWFTAFLCGLAALLVCVGAASAAAPFNAHGSVEQVYATGLAPGARVVLLNRKGKKVATEQADEQGGVLFRKVKPGAGYRLRLASGGPKSDALQVLSADPTPPSTDF